MPPSTVTQFGDADTARTRGGWTPTGTSAARRADEPPPGSKAERTRNRLLDAARAVARENGYHDTTVEQIVSAAGVARGSFYTYFESKHDALRALVSRLGTAIDRDVAFSDPSAPNDPATEIRRATSTYLHLAREHADLLHMAEQMAAVDDQVARDRDIGRQLYAHQVALGIERWQSLGLADPAVDAETTAMALVAMVIEIGRGQTRLPASPEMEATVARIWIEACGVEDRDR